MMAMDMTGCSEGRLANDIRTYERRIAVLEKKVNELHASLNKVIGITATCLDYLKSIESLDIDTMRMVSMYVGYSEGEQ